jgi:hypothetical protein
MNNVLQHGRDVNLSGLHAGQPRFEIHWGRSTLKLTPIINGTVTSNETTVSKTLIGFLTEVHDANPLQLQTH